MTIILCKILQVCLVVKTAYLIMIMAQDQPLNFTVTDLTSSVEASGRKFACENEEVVYRCEATSMIPNASFLTEWKWNGAQVVTFNSRQQVGSSEGPDDVICKSTNTTNQPYLHATLVSAASDTCVSLLIVIPSLSSSSSRYDSAMIQCMTYGVSRSESPDNETINYNPISRIPRWDDEDHINIITNCSCYKTTTDTILIFLLNITWPSIMNVKQMDFDSYMVSVEIFRGTQKLSNISGETKETFYEGILRVPQTQDLVSNGLEARITIIATNKCNNSSILQVNYTLTEDDKCKCTLAANGARSVTNLSYELSIAGLCFLLLFLA